MNDSPAVQEAPAAPVKVSFKKQMLQAREDAIIRSVNLLLAEKGFEAMTVDEVAASVALPRPVSTSTFPARKTLPQQPWRT